MPNNPFTSRRHSSRQERDIPSWTYFYMKRLRKKVGTNIEVKTEWMDWLPEALGRYGFVYSVVDHTPSGFLLSLNSFNRPEWFR